MTQNVFPLLNTTMMTPTAMPVDSVAAPPLAGAVFDFRALVFDDTDRIVPLLPDQTGGEAPPAPVFRAVNLGAQDKGSGAAIFADPIVIPLSAAVLPEADVAAEAQDNTNASAKVGGEVAPRAGKPDPVIAPELREITEPVAVASEMLAPPPADAGPQSEKTEEERPRSTDILSPPPQHIPPAAQRPATAADVSVEAARAAETKGAPATPALPVSRPPVISDASVAPSDPIAVPTTIVMKEAIPLSTEPAVSEPFAAKALPEANSRAESLGQWVTTSAAERATEPSRDVAANKGPTENAAPKTIAPPRSGAQTGKAVGQDISSDDPPMARGGPAIAQAVKPEAGVDPSVKHANAGTAPVHGLPKITVPTAKAQSAPKAQPAAPMPEPKTSLTRTPMPSAPAVTPDASITASVKSAASIRDLPPVSDRSVSPMSPVEAEGAPVVLRHSGDSTKSMPIAAASLGPLPPFDARIAVTAQTDLPLVEEVGMVRDTAVFSVGSAPSAASSSAAPQMLAQQLATALPRQDTGPVLDQLTEIALDPPELGRVRMVLSQVDGAFVLSINVDRPETLELFRRNAALLAQEFSREGLADASFSFSQGRGEGERPAKGQADAPPSVEARAGIGPVAPPEARLRADSATLDLRL